MFIARHSTYLRRRSEEREASGRDEQVYIPLLGTALSKLVVPGYKHVTPGGVKTLLEIESSHLRIDNSQISIHN
jgi:hypothetical protein